MTIALVFASIIFIEGVAWVHDPTMPKCEKVEWVQVSWDENRKLCGASACAGILKERPCAVVSGYSEEEARSIPVDTWNMKSESIYAHEARHILEQLKHPVNMKGGGAWVR